MKIKLPWQRLFKSKNHTLARPSDLYIFPKYEPTLKNILPTYPIYPTLTNGVDIMIAWTRYQSVLPKDWGIEELLLFMNNDDVDLDDAHESHILQTIADLLDMSILQLKLKIKQTSIDSKKLTQWWSERIYQSQLKNYKRCVREAVEWALENDKFYEIATLVQELHQCEDASSKALLALLYSVPFVDIWSAFLSPGLTYSATGEPTYLPEQKKLNILKEPLIMHPQRHPLDILCGQALIGNRLLYLYRLTYELQLAENSIMAGYREEAIFCVLDLHGRWKHLTPDQKASITSQVDTPNAVKESNASVTRANVKNHVDVLTAFKEVCYELIMNLLEQTFMFGDLIAVHCYFLLAQVRLNYIELSTSAFDQEALADAVQRAYKLVDRQLKLTEDMIHKHPGVGHLFYGYALHNAKLFLEKVAQSRLDQDAFFAAHPDFESSFLKQYLKEDDFGQLKWSYQLQTAAHAQVNFFVINQKKFLGIELNSFHNTCATTSLFTQRGAKTPEELVSHYKQELTAYEALGRQLFFRSY